MSGQKKESENVLNEEVYLKKVPFIKLGMIAFLLFALSFFLNFPIKEKVIALVTKQLKSNRSCSITYTDIDLNFLWRPQLNLSDLTLPSRCFGKRGPSTQIKETNILLKRPTIIPPGILLEAKINDKKTKLTSLVTTSFTGANLRIEKSSIGTALLSGLLNIPAKLKGSFSVDALIETDYKQPQSGSFHITSKDLMLPPQRIIILNISGMRLAPLILKGTLKKETIKIQKLQLGNAGTKIEAIFSPGTMTLNSKKPSRNAIDITGRIRLSEELLKEFPLIGTFLSNAKADANGFYKVQLKGPLNALRPKFL